MMTWWRTPRDRDWTTAHRPGGAAPHPRQHADNPGHQTTPTDFADPLQR